MSQNYFYPTKKTLAELDSKKHNTGVISVILLELRKAAGSRVIAFPKRIACANQTISGHFKLLEENKFAILEDAQFDQQRDESAKARHEKWEARHAIPPLQQKIEITDDGSIAHAEKTVGRFKAPKQKYRHDEGYKKTPGKRPKEKTKRERKISVLDCF